MKKWAALAVILLLGVILALQYFLKKKEAGVTPPPAAMAGSETGVALPAGSPAATAYDTRVTMPAAGGMSSTYGPLPPIMGEVYQKGECKDGSLNDIFASQGKIWGYYLQTEGSFSDQNPQIYGMLSKYFACVSLAERSAVSCDYLPGEGAVGDKKIPFEDSPNYPCREDYKEIAFRGFMAGNSKDNSPCLMMIADISDFPSVSAGDFCAAASKGRRNFCSFMAKYFKPEQVKECNASFPPNKDSCSGNPECLRHYELNEALESGKADKCPEGQKDLCRAYLSKSASACTGILKELSRAYCKNLAQLMKRTHGLAGLTRAEITERRKKEEQEKKDLMEKAESEKAEKERRRKEQEKTISDINKNIRAMKRSMKGE